MRIYKTQNTEINYDPNKNKAVVKNLDKTTNKSESIAMFCFAKQNRTIWDSFHSFFLKNFRWNWIKVNNDSKDFTQLMSVASISKHLGITPKEIHDLNKKGKLYEAICDAWQKKLEKNNESVNPSKVQTDIIKDDNIGKDDDAGSHEEAISISLPEGHIWRGDALYYRDD